MNSVLQVRLVGGNGVNTGRVEVYHNNTWGTVCDEGWDLNDAAVVCRELGFPGAISPSCCATFGQGTGTIWLGRVVCIGSESSLSSCSHPRWGIENCGHGDDAGVNCQGEYYITIVCIGIETPMYVHLKKKKKGNISIFRALFHVQLPCLSSNTVQMFKKAGLE